MEKWKDIVGYEGIYEVSNKGRVRRLFKGTKGTLDRIVKGQTSPHGYHRVQLTFNGKIKYLFAHRLAALSFIDNPENKPFVNHIDGNKLNNNIENLEWVTGKENNIHAIKMGLSTPSVKRAGKKAHKLNKRKINQYDLSGNYIKTYSSITEAKKKTGISGINQNLGGRNKSAGGFIFKYAEPRRIPNKRR